MEASVSARRGRHANAQPAPPSDPVADALLALPRMPEAWVAGGLALLLGALALASNASLRDPALVKTVLLALGLPALLALLPWRRPQKVSFLALAIGALLAFFLASALAIAPPGARADALQEWACWVAAAGLGLIASTVAFRLEGGAVFVARAWVAAGLLLALSPIVWIESEDGWLEARGSLALHAGLWASMLPWCAAELIALQGRWGQWDSRRRWVEAVVWVAATLLLGSALLLSFSRSAWLATAGGLGLLALLALATATRKALWGFLGALARGKRSAAPALALLALGSLVLAVATRPESQSGLRPSEASGVSEATGRQLVEEAAWKKFSEYPLLGNGLGMWSRLLPLEENAVVGWGSEDSALRHAHAGLAELGAETGVAGLGLALLALLAWAGGVAKRLGGSESEIKARSAVLMAALMACALGAFISLMLGGSGPWALGAVAFWLPAGLAWGWSRRLAAEEKPQERPQPSPVWTRRQVWARAAVVAALWIAVGFPASWALEASRQEQAGDLLWRSGGGEEKAVAHYREAQKFNPWTGWETAERAATLLLALERPAEALEAWKRRRDLDAPWSAAAALGEARALLALSSQAASAREKKAPALVAQRHRRKALESWFTAIPTQVHSSS
jgi:tetratricopeptide (TPR) repeat protein